MRAVFGTDISMEESWPTGPRQSILRNLNLFSRKRDQRHRKSQRRDPAPGSSRRSVPGSWARRMWSRSRLNRPATYFLAGDDVEAKHLIAQLFDEGGLHPINVGPLRVARELEAVSLSPCCSTSLSGSGCCRRPVTD